MQHGHVHGTKKERRNAKEAARLQQMGEAIAQQFIGKTPAQMLALATQKPPSPQGNRT